MPKHRIFTMPFSTVYPLYVQKAERKGRTKDDVDRIICWLTGYDQAGLRRQIEQKNDFETFFAQAPAIHPKSPLIKGVVCGIRVEDIDDPLMQKIRYLDKLIDELAKGKAINQFSGNRSRTCLARPNRARSASAPFGGGACCAQLQVTTPNGCRQCRTVGDSQGIRTDQVSSFPERC